MEREKCCCFTGHRRIPAQEGLWLRRKLREEISALADLPSKEGLQAQVLGTMLAPITSLAIVIKAIAEKGGATVEAAAPAEAPAAE